MKLKLHSSCYKPSWWYSGFWSKWVYQSLPL